MSIAAFIPPSRLSSLAKLRCTIFQTSYNPSSIRTGAKYLKRRLRGPSMISYYPEEFNINKIVKAYPELEMVDEDEEERLSDVAERRKRGKGAPKKAKTEGGLLLLLSLLFFYADWFIFSADSRRLHKKRWTSFYHASWSCSFGILAMGGHAMEMIHVMQKLPFYGFRFAYSLISTTLRNLLSSLLPCPGCCHGSCLAVGTISRTEYLQ